MAQTEAITAQTEAFATFNDDYRWMMMFERLAICDNTVVQALKDNSGANDDAFRDRGYCRNGALEAMAAEFTKADELLRYGFTFGEDE